MLFKMKIYDSVFVSLQVSEIRFMFITNLEHFLHAKRSILFSIVFIKQIFFTFLYLLTLFFYCAQIAANVQDF